VIAIRQKARPQNPETKPTVAPNRSAGKSKKAAASVKTAAAKTTTPNLVFPTQNSTSPLEEISNLFENLPLTASVELTCLLIPSISSLPSGGARPRAVLKIVIFSWPNMAASPRRTERRKPMRFACCNEDGVRCRKIEIGAFSRPARCRYLSLK